MTYKTRGEAQVGHGLGLGRFTTAERVAYIPPQSGFLVYDTDLSHVFEWDGTTWIVMGNGRYVRPANGSTLIAGLRYTVTTETVNTPASPVDGDFFYLRNDGLVITGGNLDRGIIVGPLQTMQGDNIPGFTIAPGLEYLATYDATAGRWKVALWAPMVTVLDGTNNGQELRSIGIYEIKGDVPGLVFKLPATPAGSIDIRLQAGSTFPVTITQFDTGLPDQFLFENSQTGDSFVIETAHAGQKTEISGDPGTSTWHTYRDWEIANINNNATPWQPNTPYVVGDLVTANRLSDGKLTIFSWDDSVNNGGTPTDGISGAGTFDIVEEARWIEIGEAEITLEVLQTVEVTVRGYFTSFTIATDLVLIDGAGNDYDSATDWKIVADTLNVLGDGRLLGNSSFAPPVNDSRTLTLQYSGPTTRRGLSAVRATYRADAATTGLTVVKTKYFSGISETFTSTGALLGTQTVALTDTFDFLTNPQLANDLNVQYMTTASGLFWYSRDNFRPNELITLVTDADNHELTISNNSGLQGLKVIDIDGTVTETVNPALQGSTNSVDLDPSSIYHAWVDDAPVLYVVKVGPADRQIATIANEAALTALLETTLGDGDGKSIGSDLWVWHDAMTPAEAAEFDVLEPDDKVNPGVDNGYWVLQSDPVTPEVVYPGDGGAIEVGKRNLYWLDETPGVVPVAAEGLWYELGIIGSTKPDFVALTPPSVEVENWYTLEDPATPGAWSWVPEGEVNVGGNTKYTMYLSDRLQSFRFDVHDRREQWQAARRARTGLTVEELTTGNADWSLTPANFTGAATVPAGFTRLFYRLALNSTGGYDFYLDWRLVQGEYEICIQDRHNRYTDATLTTEASVWGINRYGAVDSLTVRYAAADPAKPTWTANTAYAQGDVLIAQAPAGVAETQGEYYFIEANSARPATPTLDAAEWANYTATPLIVLGSGERTVDGAAVETLHSYSVKEGESQVFIVPTGVAQEFRLNGDPVNVSVENQADTAHVEVDNGVIDKTITLTGPARLTYTPGNILTESLAPGGSGIETTVDQATLTALPEAGLSDGDSKSINNALWVWHSAATSAEVTALQTLEPDDKANPGVDPGYWIRQGEDPEQEVCTNESWASTVDGNFDFDGPAFQVATSGLYTITMDAQGAHTQGTGAVGTRVQFLASIRTAPGGGGAALASANMLLPLVGLAADGLTKDLPQAVVNDVPLVGGVNYYYFGDRNTGGLNIGDEWKLELCTTVSDTPTAPIELDVWSGDGGTTNGIPNNGVLERPTELTHIGTGITLTGTNEWTLSEGTWELISEGYSRQNNTTSNGSHRWQEDGANVGSFGSSSASGGISSNISGERAVAYVEVPAGQTKVVRRANLSGATTSNGSRGQVSIKRIGQPAAAGADISASSIDALNDVDTTTTPPVNDQVLVWDGANWVPGASVDLIDDLTDVDTTTTPPTNGQGLVWDGTNWVPGASSGLRGEPVADAVALTALPAREFERRLTKDNNTEYVFKLTADLTAGEIANPLNLDDDAVTGKWVEQDRLLTTSEIGIGTIWSSLTLTGKPDEVILDGETFNNAQYPELAALAATMDVIVDNANGTSTVSFADYFPRPAITNIGNKVEDSFESHNHAGGKSVFGAEAAFGTTGNFGGGNNQASNWDSAGAFKPLTSSVGGSETAPKHFGAFFGVYGRAGKAVVEADLVGVEDEPASYDRLFGNVFNSGSFNLPGDTFVPTVTGVYEFINELGITTNQVWASLGTVLGGTDLVDNNTNRLNDALERSSADITLNAGTTYHISTFAGGSTPRSSVRVLIRLKDYVRKAVVGADAAIDDLTDVDTTTVIPAPGQGLVWDGINWVPGASSGLRGEPVVSAAALTALTAREYERRLTKDNGNEYVFKLTADLTAGEIADSLNLDDDAVTGKWILQTASATVTGPAVERIVFSRNRDQTIVFGDLNFMVPSSGGSSLQMRRGSNPSLPVTQFSTKWSNQQGGASEQTPNFTVTTSWRYFRSAGLNLTQHNNWQEGTFVCNGWMYRIQLIVGLSFNDNKFSCTRWRLDGIKGDKGDAGDISLSSIDALNDVDTTTAAPTAGQTLEWDGANWVPATPADNAPYIHNFDGTLDWGAAAGGLYTITVPAATHGIANPYLVQPWQISGPGDFDFVTSSQLRIMSNGDIVISVSAVPDARFPGRVVIS